jgi:DNA-binding NarL/FixJ family response regulator
MRVLVADDHDLVREGVCLILERDGFEVVAGATDGRQAVRLAEKHRPDIAVLDLSMPGLNGLDAARQILDLSDRRIAVLLLSIHSDGQQIVTAMRAGVRGYVVKSESTSELIRAIRQVAGGGTYLSPSVCGIVVDAYANGMTAPGDALTAREREVLQLVAEGKTAKEIGTILGISTKTAEWHRARLMDKLEIHDTAGLVRYAIRRRIIEVS